MRTPSLTLLLLLASPACDLFRPPRADGETVEKAGERNEQDGDKARTRSKKGKKKGDVDKPRKKDRGEKTDKKAIRAEKKADGRAERAEVRPTRGDGRPTVVFIVLDTVRSDHLSACGYTRPTSPVLERLASHPNASLSCHAYAPGVWTVPSHASFFTGLAVPDHGLNELAEPLDEKIPTLAETFASRGYQTALVSANPNLGADMKLNRGFEHQQVAPGLGMRGKDLLDALRTAEEGLDAAKPLFLFVNVIDAHDPYPKIPEGLDWVDPAGKVELEIKAEDQDQPYHKFIRGELPPERHAAYLARIINGYDYGVSRADQQVDAVLASLRGEGWLENGFRLVVTSDHGEFLGEHMLLRHGCFAYEPVTRVPLLYFDSTADGPTHLPRPMSATGAYHLALDGKLPAAPPTVASYSRDRRKDDRGCANMAAYYPAKQEKLVWRSGDRFRIDLDADPGELSELPMGDPTSATRRFEELVEAYEPLTVRKGDQDDAVLERLKELGYIE